MIVGVLKEERDNFVRALGLFFIPEKLIFKLYPDVMSDEDVCKFLYESAIKKKKIEISVRKDGRMIAIKIKKEFYRSFKINIGCEREFKRLNKLSIALSQKKCSLSIAKDYEGISLRFEQSRKQQTELSDRKRQTQLSRFREGLISIEFKIDNKKGKNVDTTKQLNI